MTDEDPTGGAAAANAAGQEATPYASDYEGADGYGSDYAGASAEGYGSDYAGAGEEAAGAPAAAAGEWQEMYDEESGYPYW